MSTELKISEPWYQRLSQKRGVPFAIEAGYFQETKPWNSRYRDVFGEEHLKSAQSGEFVLQFSGAFFPFHQGHLQSIQSAVDVISSDLTLFIHVDHSEYRLKKGTFDHKEFEKAFSILDRLRSKKRITTRFIFEDKMPDGCSRNFARLYSELREVNRNSRVCFLAGGDRAQFALTFIDEGECFISGRDQTENFRKYSNFANDRLHFLPGMNDFSSSFIRGQK